MADPAADRREAAPATAGGLGRTRQGGAGAQPGRYRRPAGRREAGQPLLWVVLGGVLRRTRLAQRRTLAEVALAARVSVPYLSEIERGRKEASSEVLASVCAALHLDLGDLLAGAGRMLAGHAARDRAVGFTVLRLGGTGGGPASPAARPAQPARPPGDVQCLLAA
jgi:hypothetical protein